MFREVDNPEILMTKQYHFDEGCGVSLSEHILDLKQKFPEAKVETRRDRDGFAIVKISHEKEWKYDLDKIIEFDQVEEDRRSAETMEILLRNSIPRDPADTQSPADQLTNMMMNQDENEFDLTTASKLQISELMKQRVIGKYRDNNESFEAAL